MLRVGRDLNYIWHWELIEVGQGLMKSTLLSRMSP